LCPLSSIHPLSFILHPLSLIIHPLSFIIHPLSFIIHPSSILYPPSSVPYHPSSVLYPPSSVPYPPSSVPYHPSSVPYHPSSVLYHPSSVPYHPSSVLHPLSLIIHPLSFILRPLSSILCPLSSILCPLSSVLYPLSSVPCHPSSVLYHPSSVPYHPSSVLYPLSLVIHPLSIIIHPLSFIIHPLSFIIHPLSVGLGLRVSSVSSGSSVSFVSSFVLHVCCLNSSGRQETWEDSELFQSQPTSDVDALGKKRYVAPHVVYQTGKKPDEPCSITSSLNYFPQGERGDANVTAPPKSPPSNLTVVTVEGCPSFIILDWEKTDNDTTEYEVISTAKGPDGEQVSILTTNQTHTAVENLKPESSYEFKVKPKNELGEGPPSEPVSFSTESAEESSLPFSAGKDAIWTQFPFKTDSYSDCHGKQYVKRTWYRKFVGVQLCNSLRYKIYLSDSLTGKFHNIGDQTGFGEDHCQFVDSFLDGRTGRQLQADQLPSRPGFYRAIRQEPVHFGQIGGPSHISYVSWYECGTPIPGKW
uniref:Fibronectin type-III domain-containing protein n=1 Tax=Labrus bergylta TaxID=56723 RepID=A0A3Q3GQT9_9LABR